MSEYEHWKGKLKEIKGIPEGTQIEQGKWLVANGYKLDDFNENDGYFYARNSNVVYADNKWYEIIEREEIDESDDICLAEQEGDIIKFELRYYNGGTGFSEMMEEALTNIPIRKEDKMHEQEEQSDKMWKKIRKKPIVVEGILFNGKNISEVLTLIGNKAERELVGHPKFGNVHSGNIIIHTLEGDHRANIGDWIIKGINGEFYPCKPDVFEKTYEVIE